MIDAMRGVLGSIPDTPVQVVTTGRQITSHAWGAVPYHLDPTTGIVLFCVFQYTKKGRTTWRFPMGKGMPDVTVWQTLNRELLQELAPSDRSSFGFKMGKDIVYFELRSDERTLGGIHLKGFSAIELTGKVRDFRTIEAEGTLDEEELDPPVWIEAGETLEKMKERGLQTHRAALLTTLNFLAEDEARNGGKQIALRYAHILGDEAYQESIRFAVPDQWEVVRQYAGHCPME